MALLGPDCTICRRLFFRAASEAATEQVQQESSGRRAPDSSAADSPSIAPRSEILLRSPASIAIILRSGVPYGHASEYVAHQIALQRPSDSRLRGQAIDPVRQGPSTEERMDLILIVLILILLFGGGFGYSRWGYGGGIGGILLIVLVVYLLVGHGRL